MVCPIYERGKNIKQTLRFIVAKKMEKEKSRLVKTWINAAQGGFKLSCCSKTLKSPTWLLFKQTCILKKIRDQAKISLQGMLEKFS